MSERRGVIVNESVSLGYRRVEKFWSDDEILELFPDDDGSLVNPLLRRAQAAETKLAEALEAARYLWQGGWHREVDKLAKRWPWLEKQS